MPAQITNEEDAKFVAEMIRSGQLTGDRMEAAFVALKSFRATPTSIGNLAVDTSPVELPPARTQSFGGTTLVPEFDVKIGPSKNEISDAARGVDVRNELRDFGLRKALGFSPNQAFSADFLARKLAEKTGLPAEQVVRFNPRGEIEFFNPETRRFTPVDSKVATLADLADLYGPATTITPALALSIVGLVGGAPGSILAGGLGAWLGEIARLEHGRSLGVHDLSVEETLTRAAKIAAFDVAAGTAGQLIVQLRTLYKAIRSPTGFSAKEAGNILSEVGKNQEIIDRINGILNRSASRNKFKLDPVADAEDALGLERRQAASKSTDESMAQRASDLKANNSALDDFARDRLGIQDLEADLITNQGAERVARPVQAELLAKRRSIQAVADNNLAKAEADALGVLEQFKGLDRRAAGKEARATVSAHEDALRTTKNDAWLGYEEAIGQKTPLSEGFSEADRFVSNVQIPITPEIAAAHTAIRRARKLSLLSNKSQGGKALKGTKPTTTTKIDSPILGLDGRPITSKTVVKKNKIDLAVLDDDIKEVRDILRRGDPTFSTRKMRAAKDQLVRLRNNYLRINDPDTLALLEKAEAATAVHSDFINKSVFTRILRTTPNGKFELDDVNVFKAIFQEDSGEAMHQLVKIAAQQPGGKAALQSITLKFYRANVIPEGSTVPTKALHDAFVKRHEQVLGALFDDPKLLRFGELEANIARTSRIAERVQTTLARSPLAKLGGIAPERLGKAVFAEGISQSNIRSTMNVLRIAGPEMTAAFKDSVGRDIYRRITTDGALSTTKLSTLLESHGGKLTEVFGGQFVRDLQILRKGIILNAMTQAGPGVPTQNLMGMLARGLVTPPLTARGRIQTFVEKYRHQAAMRALNVAVRDPDVLRAIIVNSQRDITNAKVLNILSQIGATSLAVQEQQ